MQNFNYHAHTYRCGHADVTMKDEDYVKQLINQGFKKIAFTDHAPNKDGIDDRRAMRMGYSEKDEYLKSITKLKEKYKSVIEIETGFEFEYLPNQEKNLFELKSEVDKFVLGQHHIYDKDNKKLKIFRHHNFNDEDLIRYAKYIETAIEKGLADIVVHPDLYMLSRNDFGEVEAKVAHIICSAAEKYNIPLEINLTEGFLFLSNIKKKIDYPSKQFWKIASNYNVKVLYGIDAHCSDQIKMYKESINIVNELIGKDIIKKLIFVENEIK